MARRFVSAHLAMLLGFSNASLAAGQAAEPILDRASVKLQYTLRY